MQWNAKIIVMGAGDQGTATGIRLFRAGLRPLIVESVNPADLHFFRNFSDLVYCDHKQVDAVDGVFLGILDEITTLNTKDISDVFDNRRIPLVAGEFDIVLDRFKPEIIIDCREHSDSSEFEWEDFPYVIRIGTRYHVGLDGHVIVGSGKNDAGRVYYKPHHLIIEDQEDADLIRAPIEGVFLSEIGPGGSLSIRQTLGNINGISIMAPQDGWISGILHSGHIVAKKQPLAELRLRKPADSDLKEIPLRCISVSGGVLEAIMAYLRNSSPKMWS
jgi:hypothetical protein